MNGKQYFKECCRKSGISANNLFQLGLNKRNPSDRLEHRFNYLTRKETQLFAIGFFERYNIYVAWSLKEKKALKKSVFSIKYSDIEFPLDDTIIPVKKAIEYLGWGEETVLVFTPESVNKFLEKYMIEDKK